MKEFEYKFLTNEKSFFNILDSYIKKYKYNTEVKINYYYDTDKYFLNDNNITLRIVQLKNKLYLQQKTKLLCNTYTESEESEKKIINSIPENVYLQKLNCTASLLGCLVTHRRTINYSENIQIMFDENYYLGNTDYEIEIEYLGNIEEQEIDKIVCSLENSKLSKNGKYSRFLAVKKRTKNLLRFQEVDN